MMRTEIDGTTVDLLFLDIGGWAYLFGVDDRFVVVEGAFHSAAMGKVMSLGGDSHDLPQDPTFDAGFAGTTSTCARCLRASRKRHGIPATQHKVVEHET